MRTTSILPVFVLLVAACQPPSPSDPASDTDQPDVVADTGGLDATADGADGELDVEPADMRAPDVGDTADVDDVPVAPPLDEGPLDDAPPPPGTGLTVTLSRVALSASASGDRDIYLRITTAPSMGTAADGLTWHLGAETALYRIPAPDDPLVTDLVPANAIGWTLRPGTATWPEHLIVWRPGSQEVFINLEIFGAESGPAAGEVALVLTAESAAQQRHRVGDVLLDLELATDVVPLATHGNAGLSLGSASASAMEPYREKLMDIFQQQSFELKVYHGTRPLLVLPGCESAEACAVGGSSYPCVSNCACVCDAQRCSCDFSALDRQMEQRVTDTIRNLFPGSEPASWPAGLQVHYVFKRSLGGTTSCVANGEIDVSPDTYASLIAEAVAAATRLNVRWGRPMIKVISPQNESNHPLQDGAHQNGAGQGTAAAVFTFADLIERATCQAGACCPKDRFIVAEPDVPALLAASLVAAEATRVALVGDGVDATLVPEIAVSLYLDVEQRDPFQQDDTGANPPIVTPVPIFLDTLKTALGGAPWSNRVLYVDTYPGSWTSPWYSNDDGAIHVEPSSRRVLRADPVVAADRALDRALSATEAFDATFGLRPETFLGEVGWATFDGDEDAQRRFVARLFEAASARAAQSPAFKGFLYFKDADRAASVYPTWESSTALGDPPIPCDSAPFGPWLCTLDVLSAMEGQWGLFRLDGTGASPKPAWDAFMQGLGPASAASPAIPSNR